MKTATFGCGYKAGYNSSTCGPKSYRFYASPSTLAAEDRTASELSLQCYFDARFNHCNAGSPDIRLFDMPRDGTSADPELRRGFVYYRYTQGPGDKAWMEEQDRRYLKELAESFKPEHQERFRLEMTKGLDLSLEHHRNLKREFAHYLEEGAHSAPAAASAPDGGGEGGGAGDGMSASERARAELEALMRREMEAKAEEHASAIAVIVRDIERLKLELSSIMAPPRAAPGSVSDGHSAEVTLGDKLGEGSFGVVYKATWLHKVYAVKQLKVGVLSVASQTALRREVALMARELRHPNVTRLEGFRPVDGRYTLFMECVLGGSLYQLLHNPSAEISWSIRCRMAYEIAQGLAFLHNKGTIHGALKSTNVLLDPEQHAKLTDYGLEKIKSESTSLLGTVGPVAWMAPESFGFPPINDERSDIYSLGMLFWEIAARKLPYSTAKSSVITMDWIKRGEKEAIPEGTPPGYGALIRRCWEARETRPTSEQLVEALATLRG